MTKPQSRDAIYLKRQFDSEIIGWVMRYVPEFEKRWHRFSRLSNKITARLSNATRR